MATPFAEPHIATGKSYNTQPSIADDSVGGYLIRKEREIALIAGCLATPAPLPIVSSAASAIDAKFKLSAALRAEQSLKSWAITETARPEVQNWQSGAYQFSYGYQRADLDVEGPSIYALEPSEKRLRHKTVYTGSGMSAIAVVVAALVRTRGKVTVHAQRGCYSETRELLESLHGQVTVAPFPGRGTTTTPSDERTRVLLIDSCVRRGFEEYRRVATGNVDIVLFDTTCFWQRSSRIRLVLEWAQRAQLPIVLMRSHAKLDSLGIEYGRLGSLVFVWPRRGETAKPIATLVHAAEDAVRLYGAAAIPAHFPPFTGTDAYRELSASRTATIIRNTRRMVRGLSARLGGANVVREFQHELYLALAPGKDLALTDVKSAADVLCNALGAQGLPVKHAGSFGFDFVAVEWFFDAGLRRNVIRVTGADLPVSIIDRVVEAVVAWWSQHRMSAEPENIGTDTTNGKPAST